MDTLFYLEIETGISREVYLKRSLHEMLGIIKRMKQYRKDRDKRDSANLEAFYKLLGARR